MGGTTHSSLSSPRREICAPEMQTLHTERQSGVQDSYRGRGNRRVVKLPDDEGWPGLSYSALAWLGLTCPSLALPPGRPAGRGALRGGGRGWTAFYLYSLLCRSTHNSLRREDHSSIDRITCSG